ncbi:MULTISPECIES: MmcQ/YjbR family DNA-binding protein [unclassified Pseudoalteromonas]|uniref:MmcQ/YjbR family DNA-binding protein n=1 Tax=unclassified Pseudoalteromonas TaxID=194690 RepID=UPI000CF61AE3|nr:MULTISPECIES: MmcQ/YjbR family DNA-binding protein [unclassified Pseudoalteromonas]
MDHSQAHNYLLKKPHAKVEQPFGPGVDVYKVAGKMFATLTLRGINDGAPQWQMNLKCDPDEAQALRDIFSAVLPGYHMDKRLWNTVILDGSIPMGEVERMMDNSYLLVVAKLPKATQQELLARLG